MSKPIVLKVLTAGEGGVGKTTLLHRYVEGKFSSETRMTIGVEFFLKELNIDGQKVMLQLWDFGGQERFRFLLESYVIGARGAMLLFDLTRAMTLENIEQWVKICRKEDPKLPILFLGSKADLTEDICVKPDYIEEFQKEFDLYDYLQISSKTGQNVELSFQNLTRHILKRIF
ncbi:MAG: GTP-binding protein [Promethearchaeota archaeon]|nr:MAG: GTP-binding protein [Candidatus Lokiarchaeota archaeon]